MIYKKTRFLITPLSISIAFLMMLVSTNTFAELGVYPSVHKTIPSHSKVKGRVEKMTVKYMCVGEYDGESYPCTIESELHGIKTSESIPKFEINNLIQGIPNFTCTNTIDMNVEELFIYGGHFEDQTLREYTFSNAERTSFYFLDVPANSDGLGRYFAKGETKTNVASELVYETPTEAGIYTALTTLTVPEHPNPRFRWVFRDGFSINHHYDRHISGVFEGLVRVPGCPDGEAIIGQNYILGRTDRDTIIHPEAHWGRVGSLKVAIDLANLVFWDRTRHMSYNDFSLPLGGNGHHISHRTGRDIDINALKGMQYTCNLPPPLGDKFIQSAFAELYGLDHLVAGRTSNSPNDKKFPNLHCYEDNSMHIDVLSGF